MFPVFRKSIRLSLTMRLIKPIRNTNISEMGPNLLKSFKGIKLLDQQLSIAFNKTAKLPPERAVTMSYLTLSQLAAVAFFLDCKTYINWRKEKCVLLTLCKGN